MILGMSREVPLESRLVHGSVPVPPLHGEPSVFNRLSRLPALRPATLRLLSISIESDTAISEFERVFNTDPVLTADLLIVANSPAFGARATVNNIRHAIALLGLERVRSLAFAVALKGYLHTGRWTSSLQTVWRHSIATAVIADTLGAAEEKPVPLLYTAGLMHDVGRLALFQISSSKYGDVFSTEFTSVQEYLKLEEFLFGCSHDDAGAFLAASWGFPPTLCDCIRFHHWDIAVHAGQFFELVGIACRLADSLGFSEISTTAQADPEAVASILPARLRDRRELVPEVLKVKIEKQLENLHEGSTTHAHVD